MTMLDTVYVDTVGGKDIVAIRTKSGFQPAFDIATTREGSYVVLISGPPKASTEPEAADPCIWWGGGRVELHRKHGSAVLVAISGSRSPLALATNKPRKNQVSFSTNSS